MDGPCPECDSYYCDGDCHIPPKCEICGKFLPWYDQRDLVPYTKYRFSADFGLEKIQKRLLRNLILVFVLIVECLVMLLRVV